MNWNDGSEEYLYVYDLFDRDIDDYDDPLTAAQQTQQPAALSAPLTAPLVPSFGQAAAVEAPMGFQGIQSPAVGFRFTPPTTQPGKFLSHSAR